MVGTRDDWFAFLAAFTVAAFILAVFLGSTLLFVAAGVVLFVVILIELTRRQYPDASSSNVEEATHEQTIWPRHRFAPADAAVCMISTA
jgi:hypothetical protein